MDNKTRRHQESSVGRPSLKRLVRDRLCVVCHDAVPDGDGVAHGSLPAIVHRGSCNDAVFQLHRVYDRSSRGRFRPSGEVAHLANGARCGRCQEAQ